MSLFSDCDVCETVIRYRCNGCGSFACVSDDCTGHRETAVCGCDNAVNELLDRELAE